MKFIKGFFLEGDDPSMMRLAFFVATLGLIGLSFYIQSSKNGWNAYNAAMVASSYGLIFGAKVLQKRSEVKEYIEEIKVAQSD